MGVTELGTDLRLSKPGYRNPSVNKRLTETISSDGTHVILEPIEGPLAGHIVDVSNNSDVFTPETPLIVREELEEEDFNGVHLNHHRVEVIETEHLGQPVSAQVLHPNPGLTHIGVILITTPLDLLKPLERTVEIVGICVPWT